MCVCCRAEVVDGEVQVAGATAPGQPAQPQAAGQFTPKEDFEVPAQLRQQFIEVLPQPDWHIAVSFVDAI